MTTSDKNNDSTIQLHLNMDNLMKNAQFELTCPSCGKKNLVSFDALMQTNICTECKTTITVQQ